MQGKAKALGIAAVAGVALLVSTGVAQAHEKYIYHGQDRAAVTVDHKTVSVRDMECDGNFVLVEWVDGTGATGSMRDANGCAGIGNERYVPAGVVQFRICEIVGAVASCSPWSYA
jgi:hypothetical protein